MINKRVMVGMFIAFSVIMAACGKKEDKALVDDETIELAPLKEETVAPAVESQVPDSDPNAVGNIVYYPNSNEYLGALAGSNTLTLYFEKDGVTSGTGRVTVYDEADYSMLSYVDVSDTSSCKMAPIDNNGVQLSGWSSGTQATLYFSKPFIADHRYFVLMDAGCFHFNEFESKAITNPSLMTITAKPYGIASDIRDKYNFGDTATLSVITGGDCKRVLIQDYDTEAVLPSQTMLTSPGDLYLTFMRDGRTSFKVSFYDDSTELDSITYTVDISGTAADVAHDGASAINDGNNAGGTGSDTSVSSTSSSSGGIETLN
jgi:hypothetical protein